MKVVTYKPRPPLADFVDLFWLSQQAPTHAKERIMPGTTMELVISLRMVDTVLCSLGRIRSIW